MPELGPLGRGDPQQLGPFRLDGRIGEGGQGVVYLGRNDAGELAAVKLLHVKFSGDQTARSRFGRELKAAERVASFCTARVLAADLEGDTPYIASEYIEGRSLRETVETGGPLSDSALQRLSVGTATALTAIHHAGIVHRDFKPDNVLMAADGPRVVDFGIARILDSTGTITSKAVGTPAYMAPEQISGGEVGPAADVFAWASTIAFAATGTVPFGGNSIAVVLNRVLNHEVDVSGLPEPLRRVVQSCLAKAPHMRPTADQVLLRLLGHAETAGASTAVLSQGAELAGRETTGVRGTWSPGQGGPSLPSVPTGGLAEPSRTSIPRLQTSVPPPARPRKARRGRWLAAAIALVTLAGGAFAVRQWAPQLLDGLGGAPARTSTAGMPSSPTEGFSTVVDKAAATHKITIAMRDGLPGVAIDDGEWSGFEVELGAYIARQLGVPRSGVTFVASGMAERVSMLERGQADMVIATYSIKDDDRDQVTFAGPYYLAHVDVLVRDGDPYDKIDDLQGRRLCTPGTSASVGVVQRAVKMKPIYAGNYAACMDLLRTGKVDAVPGDDMVLAGFADRENQRYRVLGAKLTDERYAVALKKGDVRTCRAVNGAIAHAYSSGTIKALFRKHFSKVVFDGEEDMPPAARCA
ncbi:serine/threonine-protein kinase [Sphaerisporangium fuscum]|uniref:serine/threonine-protein kinase n=1 Tax=Sphaerisporangium fuscum TaxID=2835868 RepID=UPI001BDDB6A1|nr:serine/threonine-protein kinase [Sphaerisporangium fuscum]